MIKQDPYSHLKSLFIFLVLALVITYLIGVLVIIALPIPGIVLILHNRKWVWGMGGIALLAAFLLGLGISHAPLLILIQTYILITIFIGNSNLDKYITICHVSNTFFVYFYEFFYNTIFLVSIKRSTFGTIPFGEMACK